MCGGGASGGTDSLDLVLGYARQSYLQQSTSLDAYRTRAGSLLAFAAVLVTLSAATTPAPHLSLAQAAGTVFVVLSAILFLVASVGESLRVAPSTRTLAQSDLDAPRHATQERLLRSTLDVLGANQRVLTRVRTVLSVGLVCLLAGTIIIGLRVAMLLP